MGCGASVPVEYEAESDAGLASLPEERPKRTVYGGADDELSGDANEGGDEKADDEKDATTYVVANGAVLATTATASASAAAAAAAAAITTSRVVDDTAPTTSMMPTDEEIAAYAKHLGMDPLVDAEFLYIAEWALTAPVPFGWSEHVDAAGNVYFRNELTEVNTYDHPLDEHYRTYFIRARDEKLATIEISVKVMEAQREQQRTMQQELIAAQLAPEGGVHNLAAAGVAAAAAAPTQQPQRSIDGDNNDVAACGGDGDGDGDGNGDGDEGGVVQGEIANIADAAAEKQQLQLSSASAVFAAASVGQIWKNKAKPGEMWKNRADSAAAQRQRPTRYRGGASAEDGVIGYGAAAAAAAATTGVGAGGGVSGGHQDVPSSSSSSSAVKWQQHCVGLDAVTAAALDVLSPDDTEALFGAMPSHADPDDDERRRRRGGMKVNNTATVNDAATSLSLAADAGAAQGADEINGNGRRNGDEGVEGDGNADGASSSVKPTEAQIAAYAECLGMDMEADKHLFYIAEWALTAPLPDGWVEETIPIPVDEEKNGGDGEGGEGGKAVVYCNIASGVRTYEHPSDEQYRAYYRSMKAEEEPPTRQNDHRDDFTVTAGSGHGGLGVNISNDNINGASSSTAGGGGIGGMFGGGGGPIGVGAGDPRAANAFGNSGRPRIHISISDGGDWVEGADVDGDGGPSLLGEGNFYAGGGDYAAAAAAADKAARSRNINAAAAKEAGAKTSSMDAMRPGPEMWRSRSMSKRRGEMDAGG